MNLLSFLKSIPFISLAVIPPSKASAVQTKILFTSYEGGIWQPLIVNSDRATIIRVLESNMTLREFVPSQTFTTMLSGLVVQSVMFEDGSIWDSLLRYRWRNHSVEYLVYFREYWATHKEIAAISLSEEKV